MFLSSFSGLIATCSATYAAAPDEIPTNNPSDLARKRAVSNASSFLTCIISSTTDLLKLSGTKPAPIP